MNKKISKFLICTNPMVGSDQFIFCSRDPEMMIQVHEDHGAFRFEILEVYSGTREQAEKALPRVKDWYITVKNFTKTK